MVKWSFHENWTDDLTNSRWKEKEMGRGDFKGYNFNLSFNSPGADIVESSFFEDLFKCKPRKTLVGLR